MAGFFTADELERLKGSTARFATLARLDFRSETMRLFAGAGRREFGGQIWHGLGGIVSIDGVSEARGTTAPQMTVTLSGVDPHLLPKALAEADEVVNRPIMLLIQLLDEEWQPIGVPVAYRYGLMRSPAVSRTGPDQESGGTATIDLPCETLMSGRARPPSGRYTDRDQKRRFPTDRFLERIAENKGKTVVFPDY